MKLLLAALFLTLSVFAHEDLRLYRVTGTTAKQMDAIAAEFEVVKRLPNGFEVYVLGEKVSRFLKLAPEAQFVPEPQDKANLAGYRTYASVINELKDLAAKYPKLAKLEIYGRTGSNHDLLVLKVSDNVAIDEDEPELMLTSATHGDELITVEVEMELLKELLANYGKDERLTKMLDQRELFFIPMVNPQGYANRSRYAGAVDPNRDYPWPERENRSSVDCIDSVRKFFHSHDIKGSIDLHAYGELIMYPWAYTKDAPAAADEQSFSYLTRSMAEVNKYTAGQISKVIYVAKGSSADYYYWKNKTLALGIELATSKVPAYSEVPKIVAEAREMIWRFIEHF